MFPFCHKNDENETFSSIRGEQCTIIFYFCDIKRTYFNNYLYFLNYLSVMKTFKLFFALCLCVGALSFASCGDDDPVTDGSGGGIPGGGNGGNGGSGVGTGTGNNSSLVKNAGVLLTSFDYDETDYLSYDDLNRLTQITKSGSVIKYRKW